MAEIRKSDIKNKGGTFRMDLEEKRVGTTEIYDGKIIHVFVDDIELPNGGPAKREIVAHPGGVSIAALTDENELLFVRQFRYPYKEITLELPAGKLEKGQNPLENGKRELMEETGATGYNYMSLGKIYPTPGYCTEIIHLYCCRVESFGNQHLDEDEFLNFERIPLDKAVEMVLNNEIPDAKTQIGVLKMALLLKSGKI